MDKDIKSKVNELQKLLKEEHKPMFLSIIDNGKEYVYTITPHEVGLYDDSTASSYKKYVRAFMDYFKEDYKA